MPGTLKSSGADAQDAGVLVDVTLTRRAAQRAYRALRHSLPSSLSVANGSDDRLVGGDAAASAATPAGSRSRIAGCGWLLSLCQSTTGPLARSGTGPGCVPWLHQAARIRALGQSAQAVVGREVESSMPD